MIITRPTMGRAINKPSAVTVMVCRQLEVHEVIWNAGMIPPHIGPRTLPEVILQGRRNPWLRQYDER